MARNRRRTLPIVTVVDDDLYDELADLTGQRVVHAIVWDDSLLEALEKTEIEPEGQSLFDLDLYLEEGVYFELYATGCHTDPEAPPIRGMSTVEQELRSLINQGLQLVDVAVDEDDRLILILDRGGIARLYLNVTGWAAEEWDELPD